MTLFSIFCIHWYFLHILIYNSSKVFLLKRTSHDRSHFFCLLIMKLWYISLFCYHFLKFLMTKIEICIIEENFTRFARSQWLFFYRSLWHYVVLLYHEYFSIFCNFLWSLFEICFFKVLHVLHTYVITFSGHLLWHYVIYIYLFRI